jgi:energy-coupling factor transporter ATP-binding protein EcfA2
MNDTIVYEKNIDKQILTIDKAISRHLEQFDISGRGSISQDILKNLRDLVEHIMLKIYAQGKDIDDSYENITASINCVNSKAKWKLIARFHNYLQISTSHYTVEEENAERLMLKYYVDLWKLKELMKKEFDFDILQNLDKFPLETDPALQEYYDKIAHEISRCAFRDVNKSDKFYVQKIKPFFSQNQVFYEVTFTPANDYASKFNRVIAFTNLEITDFYSVKFSLVETEITILGKTMPITVITGWEVAIRGCEFKNFSKLFYGVPVEPWYPEQLGICEFLTRTGLNLIELLRFSDSAFQDVKNKATQRTKKIVFFEVLEKCRELIKDKLPGNNMICYLLLHLNNKVMKNQFCHTANPNLSDLYLPNGCLPFERMPFISSPLQHNPKLSDLFLCFNGIERQHEILARLVKNNSEIKGQLFTSVKELEDFGDIQALVRNYNRNLWYGHQQQSKLVVESNHIYINGYKEDTIWILKKIKELSEEGVLNYNLSVSEWLKNTDYKIDCDEKQDALKQMFAHSKVAVIYGAAGTGKSTMINHVAHFWSDKKKLFLSQTNSAVDNLKVRVTASNSKFSTVAKIVKGSNIDTEYDVLILDECSTISNKDMRSVLEKISFKLLLLVGDPYQINSIRFGNWFNIVSYPKFMPASAVFELKNTYRCKEKRLLTLWERVRNVDDTILENIVREGYSSALDSSIFTKSDDNEIILCLNYDGLYGINNINRFLQESNPYPTVQWGIQQFKINDPILFNESNRFSPIIYNNMKGRIRGVSIYNSGKPSEQIQFEIELEKIINGIDALGQSFELLENSKEGKSTIRFLVNKTKNTDEDDDGSSMSVVPFQVAYAVSIHKSQGLEYDSVKIVITDEIDELITHNIFYTAITRARKKLKIYWTPEVEKKVLEGIKPKDIRKDVSLLKSMSNIFL